MSAPADTLTSDDDNPPRWEPDAHLIDAVLAVPRTAFKLTDLPFTDRCWLVAGLGKDVLGPAGLTAQEIADRTRCSLRLVRDIRSKELTQGFVVAHKLNAALTSELSASRSECALTRRDLAERIRAEQKLLVRADKLLETLTSGGRVETFNCGHERLPDNIYRNGGKTYCRRCRTKRQSRRRAAIRSSVSSSEVNGLTTTGLHRPLVACQS